MKEQAMQIIWGKSLPGRGINKGNGPGKSVCEARLMWLARVGKRWLQRWLEGARLQGPFVLVFSVCSSRPTLHPAQLPGKRMLPIALHLFKSSFWRHFLNSSIYMWHPSVSCQDPDWYSLAGQDKDFRFHSDGKPLEFWEHVGHHETYILKDAGCRKDLGGCHRWKKRGFYSRSEKKVTRNSVAVEEVISG